MTEHDLRVAKISLTIQDLEAYIQFKILDSIAYPGTYKKFMMARKDQGVDWANTMFKCIQVVTTAIKDLEAKEQELKFSGLSDLYIIWQHVAESNLPPVDLQLTIADCMISKKKMIPCVIIKGKGRGAQPFSVNSKFTSFLYDLWTIYKLDLLIKVFSKQCLEEIDPEHNIPMDQIVDHLKVKSDDIKNMAGAFYVAYCHVYKSADYGLRSLI